ncbi:MAG: hypothetical protein LBE13_01515 [Bacteroidales bacterium]|jgi:hypothetical protein|nr:hypothetical protein [Bacteroidales bacterium]
MNKLLFSFLVGIAIIIPTQAQTLTKTQLQSEQMRWEAHFHDISGTGSDEDNYYFVFSIHSLMLRNEKNFFILNKDFSRMESYPVVAGKDEKYLTSMLTSDHLLIFLTRFEKKLKQRVIIKQTYSKTNGNLIKQDIIGGVPAKSKNHLWNFHSSLSPDSSKLGIVFMITNHLGIADNYLAIILDEEGEIVWKALQNFYGSNKKLSFRDLSVNNTDKLYLVFNAYPDKKSPDKSHYIDLIILSEGERSKSSVRLSEYTNVDLNVKVLKNQDIFIAGLLMKEGSEKPTSIASILVDAKDLDVKETFIEDFVPNPALRDDYGMEIIEIAELDNNDIVILCEQNFTRIYQTNYYTTYTRFRGTVMTVFVSPDASISDISFMEKVYANQAIRPISAKEMNLSITPFVHGNKIGYLFNKLLVESKKNKDKDKVFMFDNDGTNAKIAMSMQSNGNEEEIIDLSGTAAANRLFRELLFVEKDKLIILTQTTKTSYIEVITFE